MIKTREANDKINQAKKLLSQAVTILQENKEYKEAAKLYNKIIALEKQQNC